MKKNISFYYGFEGDCERSVELLKDVGFDGVMALFERTPNFYKEIDLALNAGLEVESIPSSYLRRTEFRYSECISAYLR